MHKAGALVTDWVVGRIWEGGRRSGWFSINDGLQGKDTNTGSGLFCFNWYIKMVPSRGKKKGPPPPLPTEKDAGLCMSKIAIKCNADAV